MADLDVLLEAVRLKGLARAGWVRVGVPSAESVAAHSWGIGWLVLALAPPGLDRGRMLAYAVLHDLPEVRVGDLTPEDGVGPDEKARRESAAARALLPLDLLALWDQYEAQVDDEARFVRQLDRVDMAIQALAYAEEADTRPFVDSADRFVTDPHLRPLIEAIKARMPKAGSD